MSVADHCVRRARHGGPRRGVAEEREDRHGGAEAPLLQPVQEGAPAPQRGEALLAAESAFGYESFAIGIIVAE